MTRTQMGDNASGWGGVVNLSSADLDKAQKAYDLWLGQHPPARKRSGNPVAGILLIIAGGLGAAFPYAAWYLNVGWRFKDAEPSDAALIVARLGGGVAVVMGLFLLLT